MSSRHVGPAQALPFLSERAPLLCLLLVGACADESGEAPDLAVIEGCRSESYSACDVLDAGCQSRVFAAVRCLRDLPAASQPEIRTISQEQYEAELGDAADEYAATGELDAADAADPEADASADRSVEHAFGLLGLAQPEELSPESFVELYAGTVPGFYSVESKIVTLIDGGPGSRPDRAEGTLLLAHEFVHALQDQEVDLQTVGADDETFDQYLATTSVIEGEASMFEGFFEAAMAGLEGNVNFGAYFMSWVPDAEEFFAGQSPLLVGPRYFPYSYGARYMYNLFAQGGVGAIRATYANMPGSVLPMLVRPSPSGGPSLAPPDAFVPPAAVADFALVTRDSLGPWVFWKFLQRSLVDPNASDLVPYWRGDGVFIYANASAAPEVTVIWSIELDDASSAERFVRLLEGERRDGLSPSVLVVASDRNVSLAVSDDPSLDAAWSASISEARAGALAGAPPSGSNAAGPPRFSGVPRFSREHWRRLAGQLR